MKRKFTFLMTAFLLMFSYAGLAQVVSGTTYSTPSVSELPEGWIGVDGGGTTYIKLIAAEHYIRTADFEQEGFISITLKARKFGGPSATQAQISVSWYDEDDVETVLGTIDPTSTTMTNYTISSPATTQSGTGYIKIQNKGASSSKGSGVSEVTITYTEPGGIQPTTYTVTYNANVTGTAPVVDTYVEGANVTLRGADTFTNEGYTFSEWNTQADGDGDPYDAGDVIEGINDNIELYAIWTENVPSDEQWVLTSLADLTADDVFVIVGNNGANYAMANNNGTSNAPSAVAVTVTGDEITSNVTATIQWTISGDATDGYTFYPNGTTETWLYCTNANNGLRVGTGEDNTFVMNSNYLYNSGQGRFIGIYNSENWRSYTSINNNISGQTFAFYKKVTGGVLPPSISANNVEIAYDATEGSFNFTLNNPVEGGQLSVSEEVDWIDEAEINTLTEGYSVTFTTTANEAGTAREGIVTLTYSYNRSTVTKDVTVTQAGNPNATMTIAEVRAQVTGAVVTTGIVTSCVGTTGYIQDNTAAICVFGASLTVGDEINVSGTLSTYKGLLEITSPVVTVVSQNNTVEPTVKTIAEINADDITSPNSIQGLYVTIENATVTVIDGQNTTIVQGDNTIVVRGISGVEYAVDDVLTLDGNIGCFNVAQIANPQNVEVQQNLEPSITVTPATVNAPAEGADGTLAITYENIPDLISFDYYFCDAEGNELQEDPDWILAEIQEENDVYSVYYVIDANDGEARSAYFKVYTPEADDVYAIVTVNQAEYVAPTVASLPFAFDGGRADIENTDGLTQEGLDSDYSSSPKLKFNNTGDWLLLHFNEAPGTLTFDIKGNPSQGSWGGTFKVQTSEDGVTYTDLETYTELTTTVLDDETFDNLGADVRYIKWIYAEKVSGNVALGDIHLYEVGGGPVFPASITVEPATVNATAEETDGTLTVTYENITEVVAEVYFCDAEGGVATYDWIDAEINDENNVYYVIDANEGEARTAYLKVYALDDNAEDVYSNLVTINQAAPVVPPTPGEWVMTRLADLTEDDVFVIVGVYDEDESSFAMPNNGTGAPSATAVTLVGNTLSGDIAENLKWNLSIGENGYTFYPNGETETWLYCTNSNNGVRVGTNENNVFTMTPEGYLFNNATERYIGIYNRQDWRCYTSINNNIKDQTFAFYKRVDEGSLVTYTLDIEGFGDSDGGYYLIASPVSMIRPTAENGFLTEAYDLYYFDQAKQGEEWRNYKAKHFNIASGKGYLYASQENTTLTFTGIPYNGDNDGEIALDYVEDAELAGWNLIGNPYNQDASLYIRTGEVYELTDFYVMNAQGTKLEIADRQAHPKEGVFVEATAADEFACFNDGSWMPSGSETPELMDLSVSDNNGYSDLVRIRFGEGRSLKKFMLNPDDTKIYFPMEDSDYAVVYANNMGEMPVNFKAAVNGTYTFDVNIGDIEMGYLHLIDNMTGADVDLLVTPSYSFEARTTDYADRFKLVFAHLTSVEENDADPFAFFSNGSFIIVNQGNATLQVLDMNGRILQSETINGSSSVNVNAAAGTYMLRLVNGDNIKVQKVIVK